MKKVLFIALAALGIGSIAGISSNNMTAVRAAEDANYIFGENVIPNGDFAVSAGEWKLPSTGGPGTAAKWMNWNNAESTQVACADPVNPENTVLRFTENGGFASMFILLDIVPGQTYDVSFDFYTEAATDNIGMAFWCTSLGNRLPEVNIMDNNQLTAAGGTITDKGNGWKNVTWTRTFDAAQTYDSAHLWCNVRNGSIYFDNIQAINTVDGTNLFVGGDFEGWLDNASAALSETPDDNGVYGVGAAYGNKCLKLEANGKVGYTVDLTENNYVLEVEYTAETALNTKIYNETLNVTDTLTTNVAKYYVDGAITGATNIEFSNTGTDVCTITNISLKPAYISSYDPSKTYYQSESLTVNGDFEAFDVGTRFTEEQLEGAWGSLVSYDNGARIMEVGGSKAAVFGKIDAEDTKGFSSMFLMTPPDLVIGDILRLQYDFKLTLVGEKEEYSIINQTFVGGSNTEYYTVNFLTQDTFTSGAEKAHYGIKYEALDNGLTRATIDFEVSNDIIQWNSIRWLFQAKHVGDTLAIDNVNLYYLSETPFTNPITSVEIDQDDQVLEVGQTVNLTYKSGPEGHDETTFTWTSSDEAVATVDANGKVTAVAEGSAEITVTSAEGVKDSIIVTVTAAPKAAGCGGSIIGASVAISAFALFGIGALLLKKKRD